MQRSNLPKDEIPSEFICPIGNEIFFHPVILSPSGQTYEKDNIDEVIEKAKKAGNQAKCPLTTLPIEQYVTNYSLKSLIAMYIKMNPEAAQEQHMPLHKEAHQSVVIDSSDKEAQIKADEELARQLASEDPVDRKIKITVDELLMHMQEWQYESSKKNAHIHPMTRPRLLLTNQEQADSKALIQDVKNLMYALKFESAPRHPIGVDIPRFFARMETHSLASWQTIQVATGPLNKDEMHAVLKAAVLALEETDLSILQQAKEKHKEKYDTVKTFFQGVLSINKDKYTALAGQIGTIHNQPGYLINKIVIRTELLLQQILNNHAEYKNETANKKYR